MAAVQLVECKAVEGPEVRGISAGLPFLVIRGWNSAVLEGKSLYNPEEVEQL